MKPVLFIVTWKLSIMTDSCLKVEWVYVWFLLRLKCHEWMYQLFVLVVQEINQVNLDPFSTEVSNS